MEEVDEICAYCGQPALTGAERPEHVLPAAINGRLTTSCVCDDCNGWAGVNVDQPWLSDPLVGHVRFANRIRDRNRGLIDYDPLLAGVTEHGVQIRMTTDGRPVPLNSPVAHDPGAGTYEIRAKNEEDAQRLLARIARKAAAEGKQVTASARQVQSYQPSVKVKLTIVPQQWERIAAKVLLGFLGDSLGDGWRSSVQADALRSRLRAPDEPADTVRLLSPAAVQLFAVSPTSAAFTQALAGHTLAGVSLLGVFMLLFELPPHGDPRRLLWVSDPVNPSASVRGSWHEALPLRLAHLVGTD